MNRKYYRRYTYIFGKFSHCAVETNINTANDAIPLHCCCHSGSGCRHRRRRIWTRISNLFIMRLVAGYRSYAVAAAPIKLWAMYAAAAAAVMDVVATEHN